MAEKISEELVHQEEVSIEIILVSKIANRFFRSIHVLWAILFYNYDFAFIDIFSGNSFSLAKFSSQLLKLRGKSIYLVVRGGNFINYFNQNRINIIRTFNRAQRIYSPSLMICDFFYGLNFDISYLPNYIDKKNFPKGDVANRDPNSILWVRAFSCIYNPIIAIQIFEKVSKKNPLATFTMVGPDLGELENAKKIVRNLGLTSKVFFIGPVPNNELYKFYQSHYVYLNTTSFESFGMSVFEAASCGIPIVSSDVGEIPYIWSNEVNAMLFPLDNIQLASEHILKLMENRGFYQRISQSAHKKIDDYDKSSLLPLWHSIFTKCRQSNFSHGILFVGSFLSSSKGTIGPSELVSRELRNLGYFIHLTSVIPSKWLRLMNMLINIFFLPKRISFLHIDAFSGNAFYYALFCALIGKLRGKKYILTLHGGMLPEYYLKRKRIFGFLLSHAHVIITPSLYLKRFFEWHSFQIDYIPNPIDLNLFKVNKLRHRNLMSFKILWVRAFNEIYNPLSALKVLKLVRDMGLNATLTMIGPDSGILKSSKEFAAEIGIIDFIDFVGPIKNRELVKFYQNHDCYINTTSYESFGVSLFEAACCGLPICSNSVGEILFKWNDGFNYLGNEPNDDQRMAENIIKIANNPLLRDYLVNNAFLQCEEYEISKIIKQWDLKLQIVFSER